MSDQAMPIPTRRTFLIGIMALTLLGFGLRIFRLDNQSFWIDEVNSLIAAQGPLKGIYERSVLASNSLPTYSLILKLFAGNSATDLEFRARLLSVIAGALSVPVFIGVVFFWRRQWRTALLAGALLAINPLHLWYSQEVRGYAVMLLFGLLALLCFELAQLAREKQRIGWWILYVLTALMAIAVHKTGLLFAAACGLWHLADVAKRRHPPTTLLAHLPIAVATLVVLALKSYPPGEGYSRSANGLEIGYTFLTFVGGYSFGPSLIDIQSVGPFAAIARHPIETGILVLVPLAFAVVFLSNFRRFIVTREAQLLILGIGVVSVYALVSGFPYNIRYALPALFGFLALAAAAGSEPKMSFLGRAAVIAFLIVSLWADFQWFSRWQYRKDDSRAVAQWFVENQKRVQTWTVLPLYEQATIEWYLRSHPEIVAHEIPPTGDRSTTFPPVPDVLIISRRHHLADPDKIIASFAAMSHGVETNKDFAGFELYISGGK